MLLYGVVSGMSRHPASISCVACAASTWGPSSATPSDLRRTLTGRVPWGTPSIASSSTVKVRVSGQVDHLVNIPLRRKMGFHPTMILFCHGDFNGYDFLSCFHVVVYQISGIRRRVFGVVYIRFVYNINRSLHKFMLGWEWFWYPRSRVQQMLWGNVGKLGGG